jgi:uncharacterized protein YndB with AHSA1/START domain
MNTSEKTIITIETIVNAPIEKVWNTWISPEHIVHWCSGSADWHTPKAENDLRTGGKFLTRMEAKDGSFGFDFGGVYDNVKTNELIEYTMDDSRKVNILFAQTGNGIKITETFEAEDINPIEMQQEGWQTILNNFKNYTESLAN